MPQGQEIKRKWIQFRNGEKPSAEVSIPTDFTAARILMSVPSRLCPLAKMSPRE